MFALLAFKPGKENEALAALAPFIEGAAQLFVSAVPPLLPDIDGSRAEAVADAIEPKDKQPMRREVLRALYAGYDTWLSQKGDPDPAFRNGTAALSRALRPFTTVASPLDILFYRERQLVQRGLYKGKYEGTAYRPTALGKAVGEILKKRGVI